MSKDLSEKQTNREYISSTVKDIFDYVEKNFSKADLHIHSDYSDSSSSIEDIIDYVENKTDLAVIAITDHDTLKGAIKARELCKRNKCRFEVVIGEEITTTDGHLVGLFLKKAVKKDMSAAETIKEIRKQGGLVISPHPFYQSRLNNYHGVVANGIGAMVLIHEKENIDAIEVINGTPTFRRANTKARYFNRLIIHRAEVGGSDAHCKEAIGKGYTIFEGITAYDLKSSILNHRTQAIKGRWNILELLKYAYSFLPSALRLGFFTMLLGTQQKKHEIINFPPGYKISREIKINTKKEETSTKKPTN